MDTIEQGKRSEDQGDGATGHPDPSVSSGDAATVGAAAAPRSWEITAAERVNNAILILETAKLRNGEDALVGDAFGFVAYKPEAITAARATLEAVIEQLAQDAAELRALRVENSELRALRANVGHNSRAA